MSDDGMITNFFSKKIITGVFLLTVGVTSAYTVSETTIIPSIFTGTSTTSSVTPTDETATPSDTFTSGSVSFSSEVATFSTASVIPSSSSAVSPPTFTSGVVSASSNIATTSTSTTSPSDTFKAFTVVTIQPTTFTAFGTSSGLVPEEVLTTTTVSPTTFSSSGVSLGLTSESTVTSTSVSPDTFTTIGTSLRPDQQVVSDNEPEFIFDADEEKEELIIESSGTTLTKITITDQTGEPRINFENILQTEGDGKKSVTFPNQLDIDVQTADLTVTISSPPDIKMISSSSWDGVMNLPIFRETSSVDAGTGTVTAVIEIGLADEQIDFDKPVRIVFEGKAGEDVGFERGGVVTMITTVCNQDDQAAVESQLGGVGECKTNSGADRVVWTYHYTKFFTSTSSSSSGGGGGGGDSSPPKVISMNISPSTEILGGKLLLEPVSLLNLESLFVTGEEIDLEFEIFENSGTGIEHISLYTNIRDGSTLYDSDLFLEHNRGKPVITQDPQGFWESSDVTITEDGTSTKVVFHVIFSKPMDTSDIIIRTWDFERNSWDYEFENIWQVIEVPSIEIITNDMESGELTPDQEPVFSWERFNEWAGYSQDILSDEEFLEHIGVEGEKIPSWIKKNNAKWVKDGLITQNDFVLALENLKSRGII